MTKELRIFGPPGTGKTSYLGEAIATLAEESGPESILVGSLTKAAAREIASRGFDIPEENVGTLHAFAYRSIGKGTVAEKDKPLLKQWNDAYPAYALGGCSKRDVDDPMDDSTSDGLGDNLLARMSTYRHRLDPLESWDSETRLFAERWTDFKQQTSSIDFTDMIDLALHNSDCAPGNPETALYDEAQDLSRLDMALIRHWGKRMDQVILAGDDDQSIYWFRGATPDAWTTPEIPAEHKHTLSQSYRVPQKVYAMASAWIRQVQHREPKEYEPLGREGEMRALYGANYQYPPMILADMSQYLEQGKSVMVLATCGYMLDRLIDALRQEGIPFHNPYKRRNGKWNPLGTRSRDNYTAGDRLLAFMAAQDGRMWTGEQLRAWVKVIKARGVLKSKAVAKEKVDGLPDMGRVTLGDLFDVFQSDVASHLWDKGATVDWLEANLLERYRQGMEYPLAVARKRGLDTLREKPQIIVGTVHSVKGGEADAVYLFPDISNMAARTAVGDPDAEDAITRTFYVGMTRAKESLIICNPVRPDRARPLEDYLI